jgi:hypothetical protein
MTIQDQRRKGFEEWLRAYQQAKWDFASALGGAIEPHPMPDFFVDQSRELYLEIWNAALDSVVIELPDDGIADCEKVWGGKCKDNFDTGYNFACLQHEKAIHAAGLKTK